MKSVRPSSRNFVSLRGKDIFKYTPPIFRIRILGPAKRDCLAPAKRGLGTGGVKMSGSAANMPNYQRTCQKCRLELYEGQKRAFLERIK